MSDYLEKRPHFNTVNLPNLQSSLFLSDHNPPKCVRCHLSHVVWTVLEGLATLSRLAGSCVVWEGRCSALFGRRVRPRDSCLACLRLARSRSYSRSCFSKPAFGRTSGRSSWRVKYDMLINIPTVFSLMFQYFTNLNNMYVIVVSLMTLLY